MTEEKELFVYILKRIYEKAKYADIAEELGKSKDFVYRFIKKNKEKYGINPSERVTEYHYLFITGKMEEIIQKYEDGSTAISLAEEYGISDTSIRAYLKKHNVKIRPRGVPSKTNQTLFQRIDSEIKAYTLGLITADGSLTRDGKSISISLKSDDDYILEQIQIELLGGSGNLIKTHENTLTTLQFHGTALQKQLRNFGLAPNKTYLLKQLASNIPEELYHHYIRGLYDGDGVCSFKTQKGVRKVRIGFCGHQEDFVLSYRNFMNKTLNMPKNKTFNTGGCWQVSWSAVDDLINFYNYIYKDSHIFLGRKKIKLYNYLVNTEVIKEGKISLTP